jgi:adenylate cyclase
VTREQRRLAAVVSADVAGYSRLMGRDESGTLAALKTLRRDVVDPRIAAHGGRIVKTTGDGLLLEFPSVVDAVRCVLEVQTTMAEQSSGVPQDHRIAFRIGINIGDIIIDGDDIFGDGVNVAARLQEIAPPGGLCISGRVHDDVRDRLDVLFEDRGPQALKNIARPVPVWRWLPGAVAVMPELSPALALPDRPSIAVLPFQNMSGDPEQEYFADGMTEDVITELSRFRSLFVIARNSSFSYKDKSPDIRQVGRELGVRYVLEGSIRRAANRIRVTAQLIDSTSGSHVWAERYDRVLEDIFAVQEEVTRAIVSTIAPEIDATERSRSARRTPSDLSAYDKALRGWVHAWEGFEKGDRTTFDRALAEANAALAIDPDSVLGLHALTLVRALEAYRGLAADSERSLRQATAAAQRAVELDGADSVGYAMRALCCFLSRNSERLAEGLADARRAHEMNPNDTFVLYILANLEASLGDPALAIDQSERLLRLNPRDSSVHRLYTLLAYACFAARRYAEGVGWASRARRERPKWLDTHANLIMCLVGIDEIEKAKAAFQAARHIAPDAFKAVLDGSSTYAHQAIRERHIAFLRIAAGLEDPSVAEALR